jgi:hypothetical protein
VIPRDGYRVTFARRSVAAFFATMVMIVAASVLVMAFPSSQYDPPTSVRVIAVVLAVAVACLAVRVALIRVVVEADVVTVRNALSSRQVKRTALLAVVMPNRSPTEARPVLRLTDGTEVRLDALMRFKNRRWGPDRRMTETVRELAATLDLPVEDSGFTFGSG